MQNKFRKKAELWDMRVLCKYYWTKPVFLIILDSSDKTVRVQTNNVLIFIRALFLKNIISYCNKNLYKYKYIKAARNFLSSSSK